MQLASKFCCDTSCTNKFLHAVINPYRDFLQFFCDFSFQDAFLNTSQPFSRLCHAKSILQFLSSQPTNVGISQTKIINGFDHMIIQSEKIARNVFTTSNLTCNITRTFIAKKLSDKLQEIFVKYNRVFYCASRSQ